MANKIEVDINTQFLNKKHYKELSDNDQNKLKKILNKGFSSLYLPNDENITLVEFPDYRKFRRKEDTDSLVYRIENHGGKYKIDTGLYCGIISFDSSLPQLEIKCGYSDDFFKRMLEYCCGIYAYKNISKNYNESQDNIYSLLLPYLFLVSLRKVMGKAIPKRYVDVRERGYDIKGNVDIESYINHDILAFDKKITSVYSKQLEIQSIVDVLHTAFSFCKLSTGNNIPNLTAFREHIKNLYSGRRPSRIVVNNILKEKCLRNGLYADYKAPLEFAKLLIKHNDINIGERGISSGMSGFLLDASLLWEVYLYNLMNMKLKNWDIKIQKEAQITFYKDTFYPKTNYPDFILKNKNTGKIFILDAKFKRMTYQGVDVDNEDLRQLHAYSYYYHLTDKENFGGAALIYPSKMYPPDPPEEDKQQIANIYGVDDQFADNKKFGIFSIKDPGNSKEETIQGNEDKFINKLKEFLGDE